MDRILLALVLLGVPAFAHADPVRVSGIYPHLASFNNEGECGTGAAVVWNGKLWVTTYGPHAPGKSSDKLYEIDDKLNMTIRPESVGGTTGNRLIHKETDQLFIGAYVIDKSGKIRVIPRETLYGRLSGTARHITDPANKVYFGTMEEGFYEVDVNTLAVKELYQDANRQKNHGGTLLPGYHGKGLFSGQGRLLHTNNGELSAEAQRRPDIASGCLAEWFGKGDWKVVRRNQFTEVTGPGGIYGNPNPETDPVWSIGWDHRSLILMLLDKGEWHAYRLPKASHSYDGAHGWNTEWPRIRDVGEDDRLMTMHGTFWKFPKTFSRTNSAGIAPRSTYLKIVGDIARWKDELVLGGDDTAAKDFLNVRKIRGKLAPPGQSQSNLWFVSPDTLDKLGPPIGRGAVWIDDPIKANEPSEPFLFTGYKNKQLHLAVGDGKPATFTLEVDRKGTNAWEKAGEVAVTADGYKWTKFDDTIGPATWIRLKCDRDCPKATAMFCVSEPEFGRRRGDEIFAGLAGPDDKNVTGGLLRARGENKRTMQMVATNPAGDVGNYELDGELKLKRVEDAKSQAWLKEHVAIPTNAITIDDASVLVIDDSGKRWRLPIALDKGFYQDRNSPFDRPGPLGAERIDREVCTERDLFNAAGIFYELPAENAGGFSKIRPICTHGKRIHDYCSYRGLFVMSGVKDDAPTSPNVIRSDDGKAAVWVGAIDDLWKLPRPSGVGGPWRKTAVKANVPSDPYLLNGFLGNEGKIQFDFSHDAKEPRIFRIEVDITGTGHWHPFRTVAVAPNGSTRESIDGLEAYWIRVVPDRDCIATAQFAY